MITTTTAQARRTQQIWSCSLLGRARHLRFHPSPAVVAITIRLTLSFATTTPSSTSPRTTAPSSSHRIFLTGFSIVLPNRTISSRPKRMTAGGREKEPGGVQQLSRSYSTLPHALSQKAVAGTAPKPWRHSRLGSSPSTIESWVTTHPSFSALLLLLPPALTNRLGARAHESQKPRHSDCLYRRNRQEQAKAPALLQVKCHTNSWELNVSRGGRLVSADATMRENKRW